MNDQYSKGTLARFLREATYHLRWHLNDVRLQEVLTEAKNHLAERVQELMASGLELQTAEEKAVDAFGPYVLGGIALLITSVFMVFAIIAWTVFLSTSP